MHNLSRFAFFVGWMCMLWSYMEYFAEYTFSKWTVRIMLQNNPGLNINDEKRIELVSYFYWNPDWHPKAKCAKTVISFLVSLFLIFGAAKRIRFLLLPWLIFNAIELLAFTFVLIIVASGMIDIVSQIKRIDISVLGTTFLFWILFGSIYGIWVRIWLNIGKLFTDLPEIEPSIQKVASVSSSKINSDFPKLTAQNKFDRLNDSGYCQQEV